MVPAYNRLRAQTRRRAFRGGPGVAALGSAGRGGVQGLGEAPPERPGRVSARGGHSRGAEARTGPTQLVSCLPPTRRPPGVACKVRAFRERTWALSTGPRPAGLLPLQGFPRTSLAGPERLWSEAPQMGALCSKDGAPEPREGWLRVPPERELLVTQTQTLPFHGTIKAITILVTQTLL